MNIEYLKVNKFEKGEIMKSFFCDVKPFSANEMYSGIKLRNDIYNEFHSLLDYNLKFKNEFEIKKSDRIELQVWFFVKNSRSDLDNLLKPFIDYLQERLKFNDNQIFKIKCEKCLIDLQYGGKEGIEFIIKKIV